MKGQIVLFADDFSTFGLENTFNGKSAFYKTLEWAKSVKQAESFSVFCFDENKEAYEKVFAEFKAETDYNGNCDFISKKQWTGEILFSGLENEIEKNGCDYILYNFACCPFLSSSLTEKLIATHENFKSEYSFADGYPYGVCPEILDKGLIKILSELIKGKEELKNLPVSETTVFDLIKTDINSFEIETEISENDWRLYRFNFNCSKKENFIACKNLYELTKDLSEAEKNDVQKIIKIASENVNVLKTIPAYFNIQLCKDNYGISPFSPLSVTKDCQKDNMGFEKFCELIKKINEINPDAVVNISLWGEPVLHPDFFSCVKEILKYSGLSVLIETDGFELTQEFCDGLKEIAGLTENLGKRKNGFDAIMWIVHVDAMTQPVYEILHPGMKLERAVESAKVLNGLFAGKTYSQFLRVNQNEDELETFFRTFKEKDSITSGLFIIKKYDHFCKKLPECKPADLAPIERLPCWHLRRDLNILSNGDVPMCEEMSFEGKKLNIFSSDFESIWKERNSLLEDQISGKYCNACEHCDEYYIYNF